ncbi:hypothetical protein HDU83_003361 [Entophlyctis luteolus]|nr:hypothetical protein HDU83_003361 [Entophlyctis luteolus]
MPAPPSPAIAATVAAVVAVAAVAVAVAVIRRRRGRVASASTGASADGRSPSPLVPFPRLPNGLPLIGNLLDLMSPAFSTRIHACATPVFVQVPAIGRVLMFDDARLLSSLYSAQVPSMLMSGLPRMKAYIGASLGGVHGAEHRRLRTLCSRAVARTILRGSFQSLSTLAIAQLTAMAAHPDAISPAGVEPLPFLKKFTYYAICSFMAGADDSALGVLLSLERNFECFTEGFFGLFLPSWMDFFTRRISRGTIAKQKIENTVQELLTSYRAALQNGDPVPDSPLKDMLQSYDPDEGSLSNEEITSVFLTMLMAGFETTAKQLNSILHILTTLISSEDLEALKAEVAGADIDSEPVLSSLQLLDAFVKESLRMFGPNTGRSSPRILVQDSTIDGIVFPAGLLFTGLQDSGTLLSDASVFRIDRFVGPDAFDKTSRTAFLPFGYGPRICLGMHLATLELKLVTALLLRDFSIGKSSKKAAAKYFPIRYVPARVRISHKNAALGKDF